MQHALREEAPLNNDKANTRNSLKDHDYLVYMTYAYG